MRKALSVLISLLTSLAISAQEVKIDTQGRHALGKTWDPFYVMEIEDKEEAGRALSVFGKSIAIKVEVAGTGSTPSAHGSNSRAMGGSRTNPRKYIIA